MVPLMEVCVDSITSAVCAEKGGAHRLELCSALAVGGLTPTPGVLKVIKTLVSLPVFVMLRPRTGLDFNYSPEEVASMKHDIQLLKECGADGFAFGALNTDGTVDESICLEILEAISPLPTTFHRAFDVSSDLVANLEIIIKLGFHRILTSGGEESAEKGVERIQQLVSLAKGRIIIMPGAGVTKRNIRKILQTTGAEEFHGSAKEKANSVTFKIGKVSMGQTPDEEQVFVTSANLVADILETASRTLNNDSELNHPIS